MFIYRQKEREEGKIIIIHFDISRNRPMAVLPDIKMKLLINTKDRDKV